MTGIGAVTPLGCGIKESWDKLVRGQSGIDRIRGFDCHDMPSKIAGELPTDGDFAFDADEWVTPNRQRRMGRFIILGIAASEQAVKDSGYEPQTEEQRVRSGSMIGSGIGGLDKIYQTSLIFTEKGFRGVSPLFIPSALINLVSGHVSIAHGLKGPNHAVVTACATGAHAIGDAAAIIKRDEADVMLAGGCEAAVCELGVSGFAAMKALSTKYNDRPQEASRPWDEDRDGFVIGEGAATLVLEEYSHAKKRGAKIYAEVKGYGMSGDAFHITAPDQGGGGALRAMVAACKSAAIDPQEIDYINAHGTSTPLGDEVEITAVRNLLGEAAEKVSISSTKSAIGHTLGAAGAIEAAFSIMALNDGICPPTLNLEKPAAICQGMDLVPKVAKERKLRTVLSNSFGFGGTNASLIFTAAD